jgi:archaellum component FlaF (FlaF/FlaG flagellin family)
MDPKTTKIAVVAVIAVIIVAAAAVVLTTSGKSSSTDIDAALEVYGNADADYKIDKNDLNIIKKIIAGDEGYNLLTYPLADANYDGEVTDADVELVQKILDKKECTIYNVNYKTTGKTDVRYDAYVVETKWPIVNSIGNGAANALILYTILGIEDKIAAINYSSSSPPDKTLYPKFAEMESLGTSTQYLTAAKVVEAVAEDPTITAVITADNKSYLSSKTDGRIDEAGLEEMGIDVIRVKHAAVDPEEYGSALLLLGFLYQAESNAKDAAAWIQNAYDKLDKKISNAVQPKVTATSSKGALSTLFSDYADVAIQAGGKYMIPANTSSSLKIADNQWLLEDQYQGEYIINLRTGSGLGGSWYNADGFDKAKLQDAISDFKDFKAYKDHKVCITSGDIPIVARVMYTAYFYHPDLVSLDYADQVHQEFVDKFLGGTYKVAGLHFAYTFDEIMEEN